MSSHNRNANAIFCDDIRQEIGNKTSFMGIYNGEMFFSEFPAYVPKICISTVCHTQFDHLFKTLNCKVFFNEVLLQENSIPDSDLAKIQELALGQGSDADPVLSFSVVINQLFLGLAFDKPSFIKVIIVADNEEIIAGKLRVKLLNN